MASDNNCSSEQQAQVAAAVIKNRADARKAEAEASSAETAAATAKLKAAFGEAPAAPYSGAVKMEDGAGLAEINALARSSLERLADKIAEDLKTHMKPDAPVLVSANEAFPLFANSHVLDLRLTLVETVADAAVEASRPTERGEPRKILPHEAAKIESFGIALDAGLTAALAGSAAASPFAAVGFALAGAGALLSYFKSDFSVGGSTMSIAGRALILAVAKRLKANGSATVLIDGFPPPASASGLRKFHQRFAALAKRIAELRKQTAKPHGSPAEAVDTVAAQPSVRPAKKKGAPQEADKGEAKPVDSHAQDGPLSAGESAIGLFDALAADICADAGGMPLFERAVREATLHETLGASAIFLSLKMDGSWGTHTAKTNLLTGLCKDVPVKIGATTAASWAAFDMTTGTLLACDLVTDRRPMQWIEEVK